MKTEIVEILSRTFSKVETEDKRFFVSRFISKLRLKGYTVEREIGHVCLGNVKINFRVTKDDYVCYIELDNKSPRLRSIERVTTLMQNNIDTFILLRNSFRQQYKLLGIDVISADRKSVV